MWITNFPSTYLRNFLPISVEKEKKFLIGQNKRIFSQFRAFEKNQNKYYILTVWKVLLNFQIPYTRHYNPLLIRNRS